MLLIKFHNDVFVCARDLKFKRGFRRPRLAPVRRRLMEKDGTIPTFTAFKNR